MIDVAQATAIRLPLADQSVQCAVLSPPYLGQRDYGTAVWRGGDPQCDHRSGPLMRGTLTAKQGSNAGSVDFKPQRVCLKCGARRIDQQIGTEKSPAEYVAALVAVFAELWRVLHPTGVVWLNLGDSYAGSGHGPSGKTSMIQGQETRQGFVGGERSGSGLRPKTLMGVPWRVALALQGFAVVPSRSFSEWADELERAQAAGDWQAVRVVAQHLRALDTLAALGHAGWILRSDVIWHKPNPMPGSMRDRPTSAHEHVFLLTKQGRYFYDYEALLEPATGVANGQPFGGIKYPDAAGDRTYSGNPYTGNERRNIRDVWRITPSGYTGAHFATMPLLLAERCVRAGSRPAGKHCDCAELIETPTGEVEGEDPSLETGRAGFNRERGANEGTCPITRRQQRGEAQQLKHSPHRAAMEHEAGSAFEHYVRTDNSGARAVPPELRETWKERGWLSDVPPCDHPHCPPDVVLDPFNGAGTTGIAALKHQRRYVGVDLSYAYLKLAQHRAGHIQTMLDID